jgi:hypothetical protein
MADVVQFQSEADRNVGFAAMAMSQQWRLIAQLELEGNPVHHAKEYLRQLEGKLAAARQVRQRSGRAPLTRPEAA